MSGKNNEKNAILFFMSQFNGCEHRKAQDDKQSDAANQQCIYFQLQKNVNEDV